MCEKSAELRSFCERLGIAFHEEALPFYEQGLAMYAERGNAIFDKDRLLKLQAEWNIYRNPDYLAVVLKASDVMSKNADLVVFNYAYYCLIAAHADINILPVPDFNSIETDFAPLFAFIYCFEDLIAGMQARKLPYQVISDTLQGFEAEMNDYSDMIGRPGMRRYSDWFLLFVYNELIRVGRLNFQMCTLRDPIRVYKKGSDLRVLIDDADVHKKGMLFGSAGQKDEEGRYHAAITCDGDSVTGYAANKYGEIDPEPVTLCGYTEVLKRGDKVISVHIPAHEKFTPEICQASYEEAVKVFRACYPEFDFRGFICHSWMMERRLRDIVGRDTNITRFAEHFTGFPLRDQGTDVYAFLYHLPKPIPPENVPENTSMQRLVKEYLCAGNFFFEKGGVFIDV